MVMKKIIYSFLVLAAVSLNSCEQRKTENAAEPAQPEKITDYLFEYTADNYCDTVPNGMVEMATKEFACSAVRNGNFYGRNFDYFISETADVVIHTTAKEGRHATLGLGRLGTLTGKDFEAGLSQEMLNVLPWGLLDGINDAGLFCNMNVVPVEDAGILHTSPNPGMPEVNSVLLVRALLDNCANVDEAIAFVNSHDVTGMNKGGFDLHFIIGDPEKTVVLEYIDNKAVIKEQTIMTNFFVNRDELAPKSDGIERYEILKENYAEGGESMEGMWNLLKRVRYAHAYNPETKPFWKTEFLGSKYTIDTPVDTILANPNVQKNMADFKHFAETGEYTQEMGLWFTEHNSTYDISSRKLWITMREDYDHIYKFEL